MTVTIYHNPRCSKSRQTLQILKDRSIEPEIVEYLKTPPTAKRLKELLAMMGKGPGDILRGKEAKEAGIDWAAMSDAALIEAMVANPAVIERPIVVKGRKAALGRPPESVVSIL